MSTIREYMEQEIAELGSGLITATFKDEAGNPVPLAAIGLLHLWLFDEETGTAINGKSDTDIKNTNNGTVGATDGSFSLRLVGLDNPIITATKRTEWHVAYIKGTYNGGTGVLEKEIAVKVVNLAKVP